MATGVNGDADEQPPRGRDEIVDAVLDAAARLLATHGPGDVSMRSIAAEAGVTYSLVNRHCGTKAQIIDALLARSEQRWRARVADAGFAEAMHELLGPAADSGPYLRLLAWSILGDESDLSVHREHARLHELIDHAGVVVDAQGHPVGDQATTVAVALSFVFGWRLFNPFITAALRLDDRGGARTHAQMHEILGLAMDSLDPDHRLPPQAGGGDQ